MSNNDDDDDNDEESITITTEENPMDVSFRDPSGNSFAIGLITGGVEMWRRTSNNKKVKKQKTKTNEVGLFDTAGFISLVTDKAFMSWSIGLSVFILGYFVPFVHLVSKFIFKIRIFLFTYTPGSHVYIIIFQDPQISKNIYKSLQVHICHIYCSYCLYIVVFIFYSPKYI